MEHLRTELWTYSIKREVACALCGRFYQQRYIAVVLFEEQEQRGEVCPRCLAEGPGRGAERVRQRSAQLRSQAAQLREEAAGLRGSAGRARELAAQLVARAEELATFANRLALANRWALSLAEVEEAEKAALLYRSPHVRGDELAKSVKERSQSFLARMA